MYKNSPRIRITRKNLRQCVILLVALLTGCADESRKDPSQTVTPETAPSQTVTPETAQLVSAVTSGTVASHDVIRVQFVEPTIDTSLVGHALKKQVFTFTPSINGITQWETTQALVFRPNRPLPLRQSYQASLDLAALGTAFTRLQPLHFSFDVAGREILTLEGDFELKAANDPRYLIYQGRLELTEEADLQRVYEATTLRRGETLLPLSWQADATGKVFTFTSSGIEWEESPKNYTLMVDDAKLELSQPYRMDIPVARLQDMVLETVRKAIARWGLPDGVSLRLGRGAIDGFAFTPDGQWLTLSSSVGLWYYDVATGAVAALQVEGRPPFAGVVSPDSSSFTSMRWLNFEPGLEVLSEDRATLASATGDTIRVLDTATGEIRFEEQLGTGRIRAVAYWPDPFALAAASGDTILLWREGEGGVKILSTLLGQADEVRALTILPDGATLASASIARIEEHSSSFGSGEIRLWDLASGRSEVSRTFIIPKYTCCLDWGNMSFSRDGSTLGAGGYETVFLWDVTTGQLAARLEDPDLSGNVIRVVFSPDGRTVASRINTRGNHIRLWDVATGESRYIGAEEHMSLTPEGFSLDGSMFATQSIWDVSTSYGGGRYWEHEGTTVLFWDTRTGQITSRVPPFSHGGSWAGGVTPVRRSPDFKTLAAGVTNVERGGATSGWVELYDTITGRRVQLSHEAGIDSVAFSPDGDILVSYMRSDTADGKYYDETIRLWDVATGELLLAASEDTVVTLQHPATSQSIATVNRSSVAFAGGGPSVPSPQVMATADGDTAWVSPDSSVVATVSRGTILLWDMVP